MSRKIRDVICQLGPRSAPERAVLFLITVASALGALLLYKIVLRVMFPCDGIIWSESPFMTNMMKLSSGRPVYTDPSDANSMIYAPALEYVTFAVLRPLGMQLDIRACRVAVIVVGLAAAAVGGRVMVRLVDALGARPRRLPVLAFLTLVLVLFHNITADVPHPDNLYTLHACSVLALTLATSARKSYRLAIVAIVVAGLGAVIKQTAVASMAGVALIVFIELGRQSVARIAALLVTATAVGGFALYFVVGDANARFFTLELLSGHAIDRYRAIELIEHDLMNAPHRILLLLAIIPSAWFFALDSRPEVKRWLRCWGAIGVFEVASSLASYFKVLGTPNSLGILDVWATLIVLPACVALIRGTLKAGSDASQAGVAVGGAFGLLLLIALFPLRFVPTPAELGVCRAIHEGIAADVQAGQRVLLSHGVMPLVRAGVTDVPLDRASTVWEMNWGGVGGRAGTANRIRSHHYDKIYLWVALYPPDILALIDREYHEVAVIAGDDLPLRWEDLVMGANHRFMHGSIRVLEANR